jgi:penicillin-binding protein 1C
VRAAWRPSDLRVLDRDGVVVHELRLDPTRRRLAWTPLGDVSPALPAAVIASEDRRFFQHGGVDGRAVVAATLGRLRGGPSRGASTISMQLASMLDRALARSGGPRTASQKWRQMRLAWALERSWSKAEILEAYVNLVSFRGELQGVAAAAGVLFDKRPHGLAAGEAAVLAALLRAPAADAATVERRAAAIEGAASAAEVTAAVARALAAPDGAGPRVAMAPHLARRVLRDRTAGDTRSTLDVRTQRVAVTALTKQLLAVRSDRVNDGAALVLDNATGDVLAYVGGAGELSSAPHVDGVQARRQAGSTLKPFLYAAALDQRLLTPASLLEDSPLDVPVPGGIYRPQNYDDRFRGLVTTRTALASSLNVPAVRVLGLVGPGPFVAQLSRLGFGLRESGEYYGPSLALGSADVSLWELANAYRALANGGAWAPARVRAESAPGVADRVYSAEAAFLVSQILSDREARAATFGLENPLGTPYWAAVKTGTSKDMRDNWCAGYSRRYTVAVWVGNFSGRPMRNVSGITGAAPAWLEIMDALHAGGIHRMVGSPAAAPPDSRMVGSPPDSINGPPSPPAGLVQARVTARDGARLPRREWFLAGTEPLEVAVVPATSLARILAPVSGAIIAVDPDIPRDRQRVAFEARDATPSHRWVLDGADLGSGRELVLWEPRRGKHTLVLVDGGRRAHEVSFEVR